MRRALACAALALLTACAIYGFVHERLFQESPWLPEGLVRLAWYAAVFWTVTGLIIWLRPGWLGPIATGFVMIYSVWWCSQYFEPWAPLAVIYFLGSCFFLGRLIARETDGVTALLLGLAIWIFTISIAVYFPINTRLVYAVAFAIPYLWVVGSGKWEVGRE